MALITVRRDVWDAQENGLAVNVKDFGAVGDGVADDAAAFQATIDATTDGAIAVLHVPVGTYAGTLTTLTFGTRTLVWVEDGDVTYSSGPPPGNRNNTKFSGDVSRPWYFGENGYIDNTTDGTATDRPTVRVQRTANHTGGTPTQNSSALSILNTINASTGRVDNFENAIVGQVDSHRNDTVTGAPNISVYQGTCFKHQPSLGGFFGANFVARDQTTRASSVSFGGLIGTEIDVVSSGPDDLNQRIGLDVIARAYDTSADGAASTSVGVLVRPANSSVIGSVPMNIGTGIKVEDGTLGSVTTGQSIEAGDTTGLSVNGFTPSNAHIEVLGLTSGVLKVGGQNSGNGQTISQILNTGRNSSSAKVNYVNVQATIGDNTAGAENGSLAVQTRRAGTLTNEVIIADGLQIGAPTGGAKGVGSINVAGDVYKNDSAYGNPDYVFEHEFTGQIEQFADNPGAAQYTGRLGIDALGTYVQENYKLPGMTDTPLGMFGRTDQLLEKVEELTLHILDLHERIKVLEGSS